jgi:hypothetical protein
MKLFHQKTKFNSETDGTNMSKNSISGNLVVEK